MYKRGVLGLFIKGGTGFMEGIKEKWTDIKETIKNEYGLTVRSLFRQNSPI